MFNLFVSYTISSFFVFFSSSYKCFAFPFASLFRAVESSVKNNFVEVALLVGNVVKMINAQNANNVNRVRIHKKVQCPASPVMKDNMAVNLVYVLAVNLGSIRIVKNKSNVSSFFLFGCCVCCFGVCGASLFCGISWCFVVLVLLVRVLLNLFAVAG